MLGMFQTATALRYLRRYVGRHRARGATPLVTSLAAASFAGALSGGFVETFSEPSTVLPSEAAPVPSEQTAN
jgi:hypothetical protein